MEDIDLRQLEIMIQNALDDINRTIGGIQSRKSATDVSGLVRRCQAYKQSLNQLLHLNRLRFHLTAADEHGVSSEELQTVINEVNVEIVLKS